MADTNSYPLVSVIIPTYKRDTVLTRAIDSVLNQTYKNIQVIVVDDNNPDTEWRRNTIDIMRKYADYSNVQYVLHEKNKNGAAARNTGIRNAVGQYIAFLDDDDWFYPEKIEYQVYYLMENKKYDACYCWRVQNRETICGLYTGKLSRELLLESFSPTTPSLMFTRDSLLALGGFNESYRRHQDYELLLRFFEYFEIGVVEKVLVEIGDNEGENELHGIALEENKQLFLDDFSSSINKLSIKDGKRIRCHHYIDIALDYATHADIIRSAHFFAKSNGESVYYTGVELFEKSRAYCRLHIRRWRDVKISKNKYNT